MILTEKKTLSEILKSLEDKKNIFLLACNGCPESAQTGGKKELMNMEEEIKKAGKNISGKALIDFLCNKILVNMRLKRHAKEIAKTDAVLILSCGIGVQAASKAVDLAVFPALNTISLGGFQGLWPSDERCQECGNCVLDMTSGVCPITFCSKSLLNGPCGGAKDGKCEVNSEIDCGWHLIYERARKTKSLDKLKQYLNPRDFNKMLPSPTLRKTRFYDIEK